MCGIVGVAGNLINKYEKAFENLLVVDSIRGKHSTGVLAVASNTDDVTVSKMACNAIDFIDTKQYEKALSGFSRVLLGHNRYATIGKVNNINAHPFEFSNVIGVHNGTLQERSDLYNQHLYDTDSESLYSHINRHGIEDALQNCAGAYALVWWDREQETLNFLRNKDRTLFIGFEDKTHNMIFASEAWMIYGAATRNGITVDPGKVFLLPEDTLYSFKVTNKGVDKPRIKEVKGRSPKVVTYTNRHYGLFAHSNHNHNHQWAKEAQKKSLGVNQNTNSKSSDHPLKGKKDVLVKVGMSVHTPKGLGYFNCSTPEYKTADGKEQDKIRVYITNRVQKLDIKHGDYFFANLHNATTLDGFVTVDVNSISLVDSKVADKMAKERSGDLFKDASGNFIPKAEWLEKYGKCDWCTDEVVPTGKHLLTKDGQSFCSTCMETSDVKEFITA